MKYFFPALILMVSLAGAAATVKHFWRGETLSKAQVTERWGDTAFDAEKFKNGNEAIRSKMAASLLRNPAAFTGLDALDIRKTLGNFDGFYFRDNFPTYIIHTETDNSDSTWQLVFLLDNKFKVSSIIVHKNCCD